MGKCPVARCGWKGSAKAFQKHYASKHYKSRAKKDQGKVKVFKKPGFTKRQR